jgi:hypothetical protein
MIISLRTMASKAIKMTVRTWTMPCRRSATTSSDRLNSSAMITVKIIPNNAWNTA